MQPVGRLCAPRCLALKRTGFLSSLIRKTYCLLLPTHLRFKNSLFHLIRLTIGMQPRQSNHLSKNKILAVYNQLIINFDINFCFNFSYNLIRHTILNYCSAFKKMVSLYIILVRIFGDNLMQWAEKK